MVLTERQILGGVLAAALLLTYLMVQSERWENQHLVEQNHHLADENQKLVAQLISASAAHSFLSRSSAWPTSAGFGEIGRALVDMIWQGWLLLPQEVLLFPACFSSFCL